MGPYRPDRKARLLKVIVTTTAHRCRAVRCHYLRPPLAALSVTNDRGLAKAEAEAAPAGRTGATENGDIDEERGNWVCHPQHFPSLSKVKSVGTQKTKSPLAAEGGSEAPPMGLVIDSMSV
jgi:hypothetical protein